MRKVQIFLVGMLLVLGIGGQVQAAPTPFEGKMGLQILTLVGSASGNGFHTVTTSTGSGKQHLEGFTLPAGNISTLGLSLPVTDPAAAPVGGIQLTVQNGFGNFAGGASLGGVMPMLGFAKVCLFGPCSAAAANISVPLTVVGSGGTTFASAFVNVTVTGNPWTIAPVQFGTTTVAGFGHGPASATSSTASVSGVVRVVTPVFISTNIPASAIVPTFAFLDLHLGVPEPGTLALFASGIATFVLLGRNRRR